MINDFSKFKLTNKCLEEIEQREIGIVKIVMFNVCYIVCCRENQRRENNPRSMSGSPKVDHSRYIDERRNRHQGFQPQTSTATRQPKQIAWQQPVNTGQHSSWQYVEPKGGRKGGGGGQRGGGKGQSQLVGDNLTWQQQGLMQGHQSAKKTNSTGPPVRTPQQTVELFDKLKDIFPDELAKIQRILDNHSRETDLERLSLHLLDIMDED